ncbi:RloB family protein [Longimicrobium sp.]|uniref:RloB family protein n=1 Tax=Longimicrobium sp. TaxID=2029185 RepID=UPI002C0539EC|nr:RloB family protein [Longimicrobium sp.]HSU14763.1 RloB family protein [Longimicrobium sp.]
MILVVCEGKVTEPQYVEGFRLARGANTVRVRVESPGGDPLALVERAIAIRDDAAQRAKRERDDNLRFDEVWCVLDVDQHARLEAARTLAGKADVQLALSNPCFELWLFLHFAEHAAHVKPDQAARLLRKHLPQYDKHLRFEDLDPGYADAVRRAEALDRHHAGLDQEGANPSTGVYRLTEQIRRFGKEARL